MEEAEKFYTVRGYQLLEQNKKLLTSAMEDYLEMIYRKSLNVGYIRINTLSELLNVKAPSATKMIQRLSKLGLTEYQKYGTIRLTENGRIIGKFLLERHNSIETFLKNLGVADDLLTETELIEHNISVNTLYRFKLFNKFLKDNPDIKMKYEQYVSMYLKKDKYSID